MTESSRTTSSADATRADAYVRRNAAHYEALLELLDPRVLRPETLLTCVQAVADYAQFHHPGRFADGRLENVAIDLGRELRPDQGGRLDAPRPGGIPSGKRRNVLHVATEVCSVGGHTRTIKHWALNDAESSHWLAVTAQQAQAVPGWITEAIESSGGKVVLLPAKAPILSRAAWLRELARSGFDVAIIHHFGHDPVPTVAFAAAGGPPSAVLNHADHLFWLGGSSDFIIQLRRVSKILDARRFVRRDVIVPIPLAERRIGLSKEEARRALGIPADQPMLLSVGRATKYQPTATHDFFRSAARVLERHRDAHLYVVGLGPDDGVPAPEAVADRVHLVGSVEDPSAFQVAADVYVEAFPFGSQTSTLEAGFAGLAPVLAWKPPCPLLVTSDDALDGVAENAGSEDEYVEQASRLLGDAALRRELAGRFQRQVISCHLGEEWHARVAALYREASATPHNATSLPPGEFQATDIDSAISAWQANSKGDFDARVSLPKRRQVVLECAFTARELGDYTGSFNILRLGASRWGYDRKLMSAAAKLLPHGLLSLFRESRGRAAAI